MRRISITVCLDPASPDRDSYSPRTSPCFVNSRGSFLTEMALAIPKSVMTPWLTHKKIFPKGGDTEQSFLGCFRHRNNLVVYIDGLCSKLFRGKLIHHEPARVFAQLTRLERIIKQGCHLPAQIIDIIGTRQ